MLKNFIIRLLGITLLGGALHAAPPIFNNARALYLKDQITASDYERYDEFGYRVKVHGDYLYVGATGNAYTDTWDAPGSVYVFKKESEGNYVEVANLTASDITDDTDNFGYAIDASDNYVLIGAVGKDNAGTGDTDEVYVFKNNGDETFTEVAKLTPSFVKQDDYFGRALVVTDEYAIVGAAASAAAANNGAVYVFTNDGNDSYTEIQRILRPTATGWTANGGFGFALALMNDYLLVGTPDESSGGTKYGGIWVYTRESNNTFTQTSLLMASDQGSTDQFGFTLAPSGNLLAVGTPWDDDTGSDMGAVYIYQHDGSGGFTEITKITETDHCSYYGISMSLSADFLAVQARGCNNDTINYSYVNNGDGTFTKIGSISSPIDGGETTGVALMDRELVVGSPDYNIGTVPGAGSAYVYDLAIGNTVPEGTIEAITFDSDATGYAIIKGRDSGLFRLESNGTVMFNSVPDYEKPLDTDGDNVYMFEVNATNADGSTVEMVKITVTDVNPEYTLDLSNHDINETLGSATVGTITHSNGDTPVYRFCGGLDDSLFAISGDVLSTHGALDDETKSVYQVCVTSDNSFDALFDINVRSLDPKITNEMTYAQLQKMAATDGAANDRFGYSVAISGDYALVGSDWDDDMGNSSGSAYVFKNDGSGLFVQTAKLTAPDGAIGDYFGGSVALSGAYALVGAYEKLSKTGAVYVFRNSGDGNFVYTGKLMASDAAAGDRFGYSISLSGEYALIGSYWDDDGGSAAGSAYVFKNNNGTFVQTDKLTASDAATNDYFGYSVSLSGDYALIGSYMDDDGL